MSAIMHVFGKIPTPKAKHIKINDISGFTPEMLKPFMKDGMVIRCNDDCYKYKGTEPSPSTTSTRDFIRVKENNDVVADLLLPVKAEKTERRATKVIATATMQYVSEENRGKITMKLVKEILANLKKLAKKENQTDILFEHSSENRHPVHVLNKYGSVVIDMVRNGSRAIDADFRTKASAVIVTALGLSHSIYSVTCNNNRSFLF